MRKKRPKKPLYLSSVTKSVTGIYCCHKITISCSIFTLECTENVSLWVNPSNLTAANITVQTLEQ